MLREAFLSYYIIYDSEDIEYCETSPILDIILSFGPLKAEEKWHPNFFKACDTFFQNPLGFYFYQNNYTNLLYTTLYSAMGSHA